MAKSALLHTMKFFQERGVSVRCCLIPLEVRADITWTMSRHQNSWEWQRQILHKQYSTFPSRYNIMRGYARICPRSFENRETKALEELMLRRYQWRSLLFSVEDLRSHSIWFVFQIDTIRYYLLLVCLVQHILRNTGRITSRLCMVKPANKARSDYYDVCDVSWREKSLIRRSKA